MTTRHKVSNAPFKFSPQTTPTTFFPALSMVNTLRNRPGLIVFMACLIVAAVVAAVYAPGFNGFWLGDDLPNLHRVYAQSQQGTLLADTLRQFSEPVPSAGAFYRPMMMLSLALNYAIAEAYYAGWYLFNFAVHVANTLLVVLIVRRFAERCQCDATVAAPLAALLFGLCPVIAEGVYWMSARSDGWVTLLSLAGVYFWIGGATSVAARSAYLLPLLMIPALGFKESAAVLPLQMGLLAFGWQGTLSRSQRGAVFATFVAAALFLAWRAFLFGNAWHVYTPDAAGSIALHVKLWNSLRSIGPWWSALATATPLLGGVYVACCAAGIVLLVSARPAPQWRLALALAGASGGLALATLLNVGAMSSLGEGGRLGYGPVAWLALAIGVCLSQPPAPVARTALARTAATVVLALAAVVGSGMLITNLRAAWQAQDSMRLITQSIAPWAASHPGLTMLLVPENDGAMVMARNAQGGIVLEPIQKQPYLHRILPTLLPEVQLRQEQFCRGMATRLEIIQPRLVNTETLAAISERAEAVWPKHVACWSKSQRKIVALKAPPMDASCEAWLESIRTDVAICEQ